MAERKGKMNRVTMINQGCVSINSSGGKEICRASRKAAHGQSFDGRWFLYMPSSDPAVKSGERGPDVTGIIYNHEALVEAAEKFAKGGEVTPCQHLDYALTLDGGTCNDCGIDLHECPENPHRGCGECAPGQCPED